MVVATLVGGFLAKAIHKMGLGCLDQPCRGSLRICEGALLVTVCILVAVAFFPETHWLAEARLPRYFFGACHLSTRVSPAESVGRGAVKN